MGLDPTNITAPRSRQDAVTEIAQYIKSRGLDIKCFEVVDGALHAIWPELYNKSKDAALVLTINVYIEIARQEGFEVTPPELLAAKIEGLI